MNLSNYNYWPGYSQTNCSAYWGSNSVPGSYYTGNANLMSFVNYLPPNYTNPQNGHVAPPGQSVCNSFPVAANSGTQVDSAPSYCVPNFSNAFQGPSYGMSSQCPSSGNYSSPPFNVGFPYMNSSESQMHNQMQPPVNFPPHNSDVPSYSNQHGSYGPLYGSTSNSSDCRLDYPKNHLDGDQKKRFYKPLQAARQNNLVVVQTGDWGSKLREMCPELPQKQGTVSGLKETKTSPDRSHAKLEKHQNGTNKSKMLSKKKPSCAPGNCKDNEVEGKPSAKRAKQDSGGCKNLPNNQNSEKTEKTNDTEKGITEQRNQMKTKPLTIQSEAEASRTSVSFLYKMVTDAEGYSKSGSEQEELLSATLPEYGEAKAIKKTSLYSPKSLTDATELSETPDVLESFSVNSTDMFKQEPMLTFGDLIEGKRAFGIPSLMAPHEGMVQPVCSPKSGAASDAKEVIMMLQSLKALPKTLNSFHAAVAEVSKTVERQINSGQESVLDLFDKQSVLLFSLIGDKISVALKDDSLDFAQKVMLEDAGERLERFRQKLEGKTQSIISAINLDVNHVAKVTVGKDIKEVLDFIRNSILYLGHDAPTDEQLLEVYAAVKSVQAKLFYKSEGECKS